MTGDTDVDYNGSTQCRHSAIETQRCIAACNILFTTPEKMEILSRRWSTLTESNAFASRMRLLLIGATKKVDSPADEVHLLNEPRGASIETIISRLRCPFCGAFSRVVRAFLFHQQSLSHPLPLDNSPQPNQVSVSQSLHAKQSLHDMQLQNKQSLHDMQLQNKQSLHDMQLQNKQPQITQPHARIITLSATLPNSKDVAQWLHAKHFSFDESYRSVPIHRVVLGYPNQNRNNPFLFEVAVETVYKA